MMNGGSILSLQRALGHHSLAMTMRYAHLSSEHLAETRHLNPLARLTETRDTAASRRRTLGLAGLRKRGARVISAAGRHPVKPEKAPADTRVPATAFRAFRLRPPQKAC
jgi:hypothetical protein